MCLYIPFYIIALLSFNYKVQFCAFKGEVQNLPLRRVGRGGEDLPPSSSQRLAGMDLGYCNSTDFQTSCSHIILQSSNINTHITLIHDL